MLEIYVIYLCVGFGHVYLVFIAIDFNNGELFIYLFIYEYLFGKHIYFDDRWYYFELN